jgi:hypothetical protein
MESTASRFRATSMDIAGWLRGLGLEQYAPAFRANDIDGEVLRRLKAEDLRELGVTSIGHRRRLLDAIAALGDGAPQPVAETAPDAAAAAGGSPLPSLPRLRGREGWGARPSGAS